MKSIFGEFFCLSVIEANKYTGDTPKPSNMDRIQISVPGEDGININPQPNRKWFLWYLPVEYTITQRLITNDNPGGDLTIN